MAWELDNNNDSKQTISLWLIVPKDQRKIWFGFGYRKENKITDVNFIRVRKKEWESCCGGLGGLSSLNQTIAANTHQMKSFCCEFLSPVCVKFSLFWWYQKGAIQFTVCFYTIVVNLAILVLINWISRWRLCRNRWWWRQEGGENSDGPVFPRKLITYECHAFMRFFFLFAVACVFIFVLFAIMFACWQRNLYSIMHSKLRDDFFDNLFHHFWLLPILPLACTYL